MQLSHKRGVVWVILLMYFQKFIVLMQLSHKRGVVWVILLMYFQKEFAHKVRIEIVFYRDLGFM